MSLITHWIGGEPRPSVSGATFDDVAPATGKVAAQISRGGPEDVQAAVDAAKAALAGPWGAMTRLERADILDRIADGLEARLDELARLESEDTGKPVSLARRIDIPRAVSNFRFFAGAVFQVSR